MSLKLEVKLVRIECCKDKCDFDLYSIDIVIDLHFHILLGGAAAFISDWGGSMYDNNHCLNIINN